MIEWISTILPLYAAFWIVMLLHELGHIPEKIKFHWWGPFPVVSAMRARFQLGGPLVNVLLAVGIAKSAMASTVPFLNYVGLIAWAHVILYAVIGSLLPEPGEWQVNIKTYVFDDFDNRYAGWFITGAVALFLWLYPYYGLIAKGVFV